MVVVDDQGGRGDCRPRHASPNPERFYVVEYSVPELVVPVLRSCLDGVDSAPDIDPAFHEDLMGMLKRFRAAARGGVCPGAAGVRRGPRRGAGEVPVSGKAGRSSRKRGSAPRPHPVARPGKPGRVGGDGGRVIIPSLPDLDQYRAPDDVDALFTDPSFDESAASDSCRAAIDGITVRVVPFDSLMAFALLNRQSLGPDRHLDLGFYMRDPVQQTAIYAVNYIRHRLAGEYCSVVDGMSWADYRVYKYALLHAIARAYPRLAAECARQASLIDARGETGRREDVDEPDGGGVPSDGGGRDGDDEPVRGRRARTGRGHGHGGRGSARGGRSQRRRR